MNFRKGGITNNKESRFSEIRKRDQQHKEEINVTTTIIVFGSAQDVCVCLRGKYGKSGRGAFRRSIAENFKSLKSRKESNKS